MKKHILLIISIFCTFSMKAQSEEKKITKVLDAFFVAMTERDTAATRGLITPDGQYYGSHRSGDKVEIFRVTHEDYLSKLASRKDEVIERYWNPVFHVQEPIAMVWADYDFHINGEFSHCGIDAFSLVKIDENWKIAGVIFNMETENCKPSPLGPLKK